MTFHKCGYAFVFGIFLFITACGDSNTQGAGTRGMGRPPATVVVAIAEQQQVTDEIEAIGTLYANESVVITSTVGDKVVSINFEDGKTVSKGDILVTLTSDEQQAESAEAQANLSESLRQLKRLQSIGDKLASKSDIDVAKAKVAVDRGRLEAIQARLTDRIIKAPFSGVLGFRKISVGALVNPGTEITRLDDIDVVNLDFTIPEVYLGNLTVDSLISATSPALDNTTFTGKVTFVDNRVDPATRAVLVRAKIPNADHHLRPGMLMNVTLYAGERKSVLIDESALQQVADRAYVYVLNDDSTVEKRPVEIGKRLPGKVVILTGLEPNEKVVIDGTLTLKSGSKVRLVDVETQSSMSKSVDNNPEGT